MNNIPLELVKMHNKLSRGLSGWKANGREYVIRLASGQTAIFKIQYGNEWANTRLWLRQPVESSDDAQEIYPYTYISSNAEFNDGRIHYGTGTITTPRSYGKEEYPPFEELIPLNGKEAEAPMIETFNLHLAILQTLAATDRHTRRRDRARGDTMMTTEELIAARKHTRQDQDKT